MKKFLKGVLIWKTSACYMFTGSFLVYMAVMMFLGKTQLSMQSVFSILIISVAGTLLQFLVFTDYVIQDMKYSWRIMLFMLPFFVVLTCCAVWFHWFPKDAAGNWLLFALIFFVVLAGMTIGFEIYFRITGQKYDGLLGQYKAKKEKAEATLKQQNDKN